VRFDEARKERQAKNEALFRSLNERVRQVTDTLPLDGIADDERPDEYLCECADDACMERIKLTRAEYESLRSSPIQFAVRPDHVVPDIETVVAANERFMVVRKDLGEREHAIASDPRP